MDVTFGLITDGSGDDRINKIIDSIEPDVPEDKYEVVIVGNSKVSRKNTKIYEFDENIKKGWITRKKNLITSYAKNPVVVYSHDYVAYVPGWYSGFVKFDQENNSDWDLAMCKIADINGYRFRDWTLWENNPPKVEHLDYNISDRTAEQYISGTWWIAKRDYMWKHPLDETKCWAQSEDAEWALKNRDKWNLKMNQNSIVQFVKEKPHHPPSPGKIL